MIAAQSRLTLIIPSLLENNVDSALSKCPIIHKSGIHKSAIHKLVSRARQTPVIVTNYEQAILASLGLSSSELSDLPGAQCSYLSDFNESAPLHCVRADPVHLRVERDHGQLFPSQALRIAGDEEVQLIGALNQHFEPDGVHFHAGKNNRWYMSGLVAKGPDTAPTTHVAGRNVSLFLPTSESSGSYRSLGTEIQMLLHDHAVNLRREGQNKLAINSVWFWGGGRVVAGKAAGVARLYSDSAFAKGLAMLNGITVFPVEEALSGGGKAVHRINTIVTDDTLFNALLRGDNDALEAARAKLESESGLLSKAFDTLKRGQYKELVIDGCDGRQFVLTRFRLYCFWKRVKHV